MNKNKFELVKNYQIFKIDSRGLLVLNENYCEWGYDTEEEAIEAIWVGEEYRNNLVVPSYRFIPK